MIVFMRAALLMIGALATGWVLGALGMLTYAAWHFRTIGFD